MPTPYPHSSLSQLNFLEALPKAQWEKLRRLVIDLVLATE